MKVTVLVEGMFLQWECDEYVINDEGYLVLVKKTGPQGKKSEELAVFNHWAMVASGEVRPEDD